MIDFDFTNAAAKGSKEIVNFCLLSTLLAIATERDKDQAASIAALMDSIAAQAVDVVTKLDDGTPDSKSATSLLTAECSKYSEQIKLAALSIATSNAS